MKPALFTFLGLLGLLAATVLAAFLPLGPCRLGISLLLAFAQAALIAVFYMGLRREDGVVRLAALAGVAWLSLLLLAALTDAWLRGPGLLLRH